MVEVETAPPKSGELHGVSHGYKNLMRDDQDLLAGPLYPNLKERFEAAGIKIEPPLG